MELSEYLSKRSKPTVGRWIEDHPTPCDQARKAVIGGESMSLIYNWLVDYHGFPFGITAFRNLSEAWRREASNGVAA